MYCTVLVFSTVFVGRFVLRPLYLSGYNQRLQPPRSPTAGLRRLGQGRFRGTALHFKLFIIALYSYTVQDSTSTVQERADLQDTSFVSLELRHHGRRRTSA